MLGGPVSTFDVLGRGANLADGRRSWLVLNKTNTRGRQGRTVAGDEARAENLESTASLPWAMIYVSQAAMITGDVAIGKDSSVWHCAVLRGDLDRIRVGECVSIQDNAVVHVDLGNPVEIGDHVT